MAPSSAMAASMAAFWGAAPEPGTSQPQPPSSGGLSTPPVPPVPPDPVLTAGPPPVPATEPPEPPPLPVAPPPEPPEPPLPPAPQMSMYTQPVAGSQVSSVQASLSLQKILGPSTHTPNAQTSGP